MRRKILAILTAASMSLSLLGGLLPTAVSAVDDTANDPYTGKTVYIDSVTGSDSNPGTDINKPRRTLGQLAWGGNIQPGDKVLLKRGSTWNEKWGISFSGTEEKPILVSCYGDESDPLPSINGSDCAIEIKNKSYLTVEKLKLTCYNVNDPDDWKTSYHRRSGIWVISSPEDGEKDIMKGITLQNLEITNVTGISSSENFPVGDNKDLSQSSNAAIHVNQWHWGNTAKDGKMIDLTIQNNYIHDVTTVGVNIDGYDGCLAENVVIRNNVVYNTGCDGMVVGKCRNPIVENNISYYNGAYGTTDFYWIAGLWAWGCQGATFQENEVAYTQAMPKINDSDAVAFDTDISSKGDHYYQYNYSHDNVGGFYFDMGQLKEGTNYIRYNLSVNDGMYTNGRHTVNTNDTSVFTNNVFYYDEETIPGNDYQCGFNFNTNTGDRTQVINNVFYMPEGNGTVTFKNGTPVMSNNAFGGIEAPEEAVFSIVKENPEDLGFVNAQDPGDLWKPADMDAQGNLTADWDIKTATAGFQLKEDSPLVGAGKYIALNASAENNGGRDYWGNPLYAGSPDIGAYELPDSQVGDTEPPAKPSNAMATGIKDTSLTLTWEAVEDGKEIDAKIYNAADDSLIAYVMGTNTYTVTGLEPTTEYSFYIVAIDNSGNESERSDTVVATTVFGALILDNKDASQTGTWVTATGASCYGENYLTSDDSSATLRWIPDIPEDGYYEIYYWQPNGNSLKTRNAVYTIAFDGGTASYGVDQRTTGGAWVLLATHRFKQGTAGYIELSGAAAGELNGDAIRVLYSGEANPQEVDRVTMSVGTTLLEVGQGTPVTVNGLTREGLSFNLAAEGAGIQYVVDDPSVIQVEDGMLTALAQGSTKFHAEVTYEGRQYVTESISISVGSGLVVDAPEFVDAAGNEVTGITSAGPLTAKLHLANMGSNVRQLTVIAVSYDGEEMHQYQTRTEVVRPLNDASFEVTVEIPANWQDSLIELYLWDSMEGMHPITMPYGL